MKITREIKTAILVIASILLFIWGYSFLKGKDLFTNYRTFFVEYENVEGLASSAQVTLNGLVIGKVASINIDKNTGRLLVELQLKTDFPFSKSTIASIYEPGLIGGKQIAIILNLKDKSIILDGEKFIGEIKLGLTDKMGNKLVPFQIKLEKIMANTDQLISGINNVLDAKGQENLKISLEELSKTIEQFHQISSNVNTILEENKAQLKNVVTNFNTTANNFSKISDSLNKADLAKTVKNLNSTLAKVDGIISDLQSGKGTVGKLLKEDTFYKNVVTTTKELELLLQDIRLKPTRYINISLFGKKNKPYIAPVLDTLAKNLKS